MTKVAVAGGTSHFGRIIVESILANGTYEVIVLSRSPSNQTLESLGAKVVPVSYTDPASLDHALTGVHTVISTLFSPDPDTFISSHIALLEAAKRSGVKRFAPSEFNVVGIPNDPIDMYAPKAVVAEAVRKSGLEYTLYETGLFMNFLAGGTPGQWRTGEINVVINVEKCTAEIPGDGEAKVAYTSLEDIGAFVAASLDLPKWPEIGRMAGDLKSYNEIVALAEAIRGKKFDVTYVSVDELKARYNPNPPSPYGNILDQVSIEVVRGRFTFHELNLNKLLPQVKPIGIEEFLQKWWGPKAERNSK